MTQQKIIVIHGCGVTNPGTENEGLTTEGHMRVMGILHDLVTQTDGTS